MNLISAKFKDSKEAMTAVLGGMRVFYKGQLIYYNNNGFVIAINSQHVNSCEIFHEFNMFSSFQVEPISDAWYHQGQTGFLVLVSDEDDWDDKDILSMLKNETARITIFERYEDSADQYPIITLNSAYAYGRPITSKEIKLFEG